MTKRRPLVQTTTVNEESDVERRGVLKQRNEDARKKTTADMKKTRGPFLDACKSFLSPVYSDIDQKYKNHPQYVSGVASKIASYFERLERERLRGDGVVLQSSKVSSNSRRFTNSFVALRGFEGLSNSRRELDLLQRVPITRPF